MLFYFYQRSLLFPFSSQLAVPQQKFLTDDDKFTISEQTDRKIFTPPVTSVLFTCLPLDMVLEDFTYHVLPVKDKLYRFALRFLRNEAEAQDVVQDVLIKAWHQRDELHNAEAWCMRLTRNLSLNKLKSGHRSRTEGLAEDDRYASHAASPYAQTETQDALSHVRELLRTTADEATASTGAARRRRLLVPGDQRGAGNGSQSSKS